MKKIILSLAIISMAVFVLITLRNEEQETFMKLEIVTREQYKNLIEDIEEIELEAKLRFGQNIAPYDSIREEWIFYQESPNFGIGIEDNYRLAWIRNDIFENKEESISNNQAFTLLVYNDLGYSLEKIKITTLPIITIDIPRVPTDKYLKDGEDTEKWIESGTINFYGFAVGSEENRTQSYHVNLNVRGVTTLAFDKKSYKINIRDEENSPLNVDLSKARNDNDWILNAVYSDRSKMREKYITDLWQSMLETQEDPQITGFEMNYVEVVMNNEYQGIYTLTEPIDAKQLNINRETEFIMKCNSWFSDGTAVIKELLKTEADKTVGPHIEMVYSPENMEGNPWEVLGTYFQDFTRDNVTLEIASNVTDIENLIDFFIIKEYGALLDSDPKNIFFVGTKDKDNNYIIHKELWDLNYSLGDTYVHDLNLLYTEPFEPEEFIRITEEVGKLLKGDDGEVVKEMIQQRWSFLRDTILSSEEIILDMDALFSELDCSGVLKRENDRWKQDIDFTYERNRVKEFALKRVEILDDIIEDL